MYACWGKIMLRYANYLFLIRDVLYPISSSFPFKQIHITKHRLNACTILQEESSPVISKFIAEVSKKEGLELKIDSFSNWKLGDEQSIEVVFVTVYRQFFPPTISSPKVTMTTTPRYHNHDDDIYYLILCDLGSYGYLFYPINGSGYDISV